jgi:hypothetical protein
MVGEEFRAFRTRAHRIGIVFTAQPGGGKAVTDLHALDCIDAHHRGGQFAIELGI